MARWGLVTDGREIITPSSVLLPVRCNGMPAMLKLAHEQEERRGGRLMAWWSGDGAARVLAEDDGVLLLERATGPRSLAAMARAGQDDEATRILCAATRRLHDHRAPLPPDLVSLDDWFEPLLQAHGQAGIIAEGRAVARELLAHPQEIVVLHGDIHHENVLDAGPRGWIVIDPKGLLGERTFDFVNILRDPDEAVALAPGRFARQVGVIAEAAALDRTRLLQWTLAFASLSAVWILGDGDTPTLDLAVAELAAVALKQR
ncbi:MAG: aminoglycoside phosphotransferase family protein [Reyranella sp.]|nr:aminoglycoside phosphotransferase family protein [Reyranella sp.]MDP3158478.1 aminoglycoside phosphotransferase family protein [Reyranella sp.]